MPSTANLTITHFGIFSSLTYKPRFPRRPRLVVTESSFSDQYEQFRKMLVAARKEGNLTQVELAEALGRPQSFVSKYENGERRLDVVEFLELARAIGFDYVAFLRKLERAS